MLDFSFTPYQAVAILMVLVLSMLLFGCNGDAPDARYNGEGISWEEAAVVGEGSLDVWYVPAEGFAYEDDAGQLTGVTVDILRAFESWAEDTYGVILNYNFREEEDWQTFYETVKEAEEGTIGMGNVTITEERRLEISFSPPYMRNVAVLISHEDHPELSSFGEIPEVFSDHSMLAFEGTLHEERLRRMRERFAPEMEIEYAHSNDEIIDRVASDDGDYLAYVDVYNFWRAEDRSAPLMRHEIGDDAAEEFGYIMPHGSTWSRAMEEFFAHNDGFLQSDEYRSILERHLGADLASLLLAEQGDS